MWSPPRPVGGAGHDPVMRRSRVRVSACSSSERRFTARRRRTRRTYTPKRNGRPRGSSANDWPRKCGSRKTLPDETRRTSGRTSLFYETTFKRNQLVTTIRDAVQAGKKSSPVLCGLADLNFPLVITTNFDQLLEEALTQSGKHPNVSIYNKDWVPTAQYAGTGDPTSGEPFVLKIHGDIGSPESIVITDQDYIHFILRISDQKGPTTRSRASSSSAGGVAPALHRVQPPGLQPAGALQDTRWRSTRPTSEIHTRSTPTPTHWSRSS